MWTDINLFSLLVGICIVLLTLFAFVLTHPVYHNGLNRGLRTDSQTQVTWQSIEESIGNIFEDDMSDGDGRRTRRQKFPYKGKGHSEEKKSSLARGMQTEREREEQANQDEEYVYDTEVGDWDDDDVVVYNFVGKNFGKLRRGKRDIRLNDD